MKQARLIALVPLLFLFISSNAQKPSPSLLSHLDKAEQAMFSATSAGDSAIFRQLAGSDYFTINADGSAQTLEEALPFVPRFKGSTYQLSEQKQRQFGNVVLRTGRAKFFFGGQEVAEVLYTSGWVYRDGRWKYIHWQGTPIEKMPSGPNPAAKEQ